MSSNDNKNSTRNGGKHMKDEKYKKMFSEMFSGENNPNHKSKTTEEERKYRSPFSKKFIGYVGLKDEEISEKILKLNVEISKYRINTTSIDYWINKGYYAIEAKLKLRERQSTFSLEKCINKYGEEEGIKVFNERTNKWQKSLLENGNMKMGFSLISQVLFDMISDTLNGKFIYATNGGEFRIDKDSGGVWIYDFADTSRKKIIEYQGDLYHANPSKFKPTDTPHPYRKGKTSDEIWLVDKNKLEHAERSGYKVLYIWDSEFSKVGQSKRNEILKKCVDFILG